MPEMYAATNTQTKRVPKFGVALDPGQSGWSRPVNVRFALPSNAKVQQIEFIPDIASVNPGTSFKGLIAGQKLELTSPAGQWVNELGERQ